jgi:hypothetical protein
MLFNIQHLSFCRNKSQYASKAFQHGYMFSTFCHFLFLDEKKVTKEKSRKKRIPRVSFVVPWLSGSATVTSTVVFYAKMELLAIGD